MLVWPLHSGVALDESLELSLVDTACSSAERLSELSHLGRIKRWLRLRLLGLLCLRLLSLRLLERLGVEGIHVWLLLGGHHAHKLRMAILVRNGERSECEPMA